jgi:hypothetical protein
MGGRGESCAERMGQWATGQVRELTKAPIKYSLHIHLLLTYIYILKFTYPYYPGTLEDSRD